MGASSGAASAGPHAPVLYQQVLSALAPRAGSRYLDGTVGAGGHAAGVLEASAPDGLLLGIDRDPAALEIARSRLAPFGERAKLIHGSFADMRRAAVGARWTSVHGILLDLGLSSMQVEDPDRGFSFRLDGPLDMRFDPAQPTTASDLVNGLSEEELADLLWRFGEEPRSRQVAERIVAARPIRTTLELAQIVAAATRGRRAGMHPATRVFQALRIAVNEELDVLGVGLEQALGLLAPGGTLAVISFHSLEDRLVKGFLRRESRDCICPPGQPVCTCGHRATLRLLTRKPVTPEKAEVMANPRARSARLRAAERLATA